MVLAPSWMPMTPATVFSSIDIQGRYSYGNQPHIAGWNLARFAETLLPLLHVNQAQAIKLAQDAISDFTELYHCNWLAGMRAKLGIFNEEIQDESLIKDLLSMMQKYRADYTNTFRALTFDTPEDTTLFGITEFAQWHELWQARLGNAAGTESLLASVDAEQQSYANPSQPPGRSRTRSRSETGRLQRDGAAS